MFIISKFTVKTANADTETTLKATDSDLRLQAELRVQQRIKETQGPNGHQNGHQFSYSVRIQRNGL